MSLQGKTALVTGGSRGIGKAIACEMAAQGANVAIVYAGNQAAATETVAEITALGVTAKAYQCDVSDFAATEELCASVLKDFGEIDILVNNAGIVRDKLTLSMAEADFDDVIHTNLKGAFNMIRGLYRHFMRKPNGARIINVTSVVGLMGNAGQANYAAAKSGLIGLTKSISKELGARGVTCNAIAPGFIVSDMTDALSDKVKDSVLSGIPAKRFGDANEVAKLAAFLASDCAGYITGEVIRIDGGLAM